MTARPAGRERPREAPDGREAPAPQAPDEPPGPELAPLRRRVEAGLIDYVPCLALFVAGSRLAGAAGGIAGAALAFAALAVCEAHGGRTPGKALRGLRVLHVGGAPCSTLGAVIRNAFRFVDAFPGVYLVGIVTIAGTRRRQRLGDQYAGTSVYLDPR